MTSTLQSFSWPPCLSSKKTSTTFPIRQSGNASHCRNQKNSGTSFLLSKNNYKQLGVKKTRREDQWRVWGTGDGSREVLPPPPPPPSALYLIRDFYTAMNEKDYMKLEQIISVDCVFHDLIFYLPFQDREVAAIFLFCGKCPKTFVQIPNVVTFLRKVMDAMGSCYFVIESEEEIENYQVTVIWHLAWKNKDLPYSTGCTVFECDEVGRNLFIKKITGVDEFPGKPEDLVLKILKTVSFFLEQFPADGISEGFLFTFLDIIGAYWKRLS